MNGKWYRSGFVKAALIIAAHVMVAAMTASFLWILSYPVLREELFEGSPAKKYEDSRNFIDQMLYYSEQAVAGIKSSGEFETDGKYDPDKVVDIENYYNTGTFIGEKDSGLAYHLGELLEWNEYRMNNTAGSGDEENREDIIVCKKMDDTYRYYWMSEFYDAVAEGSLVFIMEEGDIYVSASGILAGIQEGNGFPDGIFRGISNGDGEMVYRDCWIYDGVRLEEFCPPVGAKDILEIVNENPEWNGRLNEAYEMMKSVLYTLEKSYDSYQGAFADIEEGDTNFSYIYIDTKNEKVYTNKSQYRVYEKIAASLESMKESGKYVIVHPKLADFETNMKKVNTSVWRDMVKYSGLDEEDFLFAAYVDTKYPIQDIFHNENETYIKYGASAKKIGFFGCAAAVVTVICIVWLCVVAGRSSMDEDLHLNAFDRWKTEFAAGAVIAGWAVPTVFISIGGAWGLSYAFSSFMDDVVSQSSASEKAQASVYIVGISVLAAYTLGMFLVGFLSLVRRIKAKSVWSNSILRLLCVFLRDLFANLGSVWKTVISFGSFVFMHWVAIAGFDRWYGDFQLGILMVAEAAVFVFLVYKAIGREKLKKGVRKISHGEIGYVISLDKLTREHRELAEDINSIGEGLELAVAKSVKNERLKTDLITNVSHDIKTPLTSIINYVELLKQENFEDAKVRRYIEILEQKSQRLKTLTEDVVEASKVSSGNVTLEYINLNLAEMIQQVSGEFEERFQNRNLKEVLILPEEETVIRADGRRMWRVFENIYNNAAKYAMEGTRVYAELSRTGDEAVFNLKNISEQALNIPADELTERFIRGDISRNTEGSGLGLSIAKTLVQMQGGVFELYLDGDLFKVTVRFPIVK